MNTLKSSRCSSDEQQVAEARRGLKGWQRNGFPPPAPASHLEEPHPQEAPLGQTPHRDHLASLPLCHSLPCQTKGAQEISS